MRWVRRRWVAEDGYEILRDGGRLERGFAMKIAKHAVERRFGEEDGVQFEVQKRKERDDT